MKTPLLSLALIALLASCSNEGNNTENKETESNTTETLATCTYAYNAESAAVLWEAYKFTNKAAVGGRLENFMVSGTAEGASASEVLTGATIKVVTASINSKDPVRDGKLVDIFFKALNTDTIVGSIKRIEGNNAVCNFTLNGVSKDVNMEVNMLDIALELKGEINLSDFNGDEAVTTLNAACNDLHTGSDGVSKLWPNISISFVADLDKTCE